MDPSLYRRYSPTYLNSTTSLVGPTLYTIPQNNPAERVNQLLGNCTRCFVGDDHREWDRDLEKNNCAVNTSHHKATQSTPYFFNHGRQILAEKTKRLEQVYEKVRKCLDRAYARNIKCYNLRVRPVSDTVFGRIFVCHRTT
jgi:hypothetical protein